MPKKGSSRVIRADEIGYTPIKRDLIATEKDLDAVAERLGLVSLSELTAAYELVANKKGIISVKGHVRAVLEQECVVSGLPVPEMIDEKIDLLFDPSLKEDLPMPDLPEEELAIWILTVPEALPEGRLDLADLAVQHVSLAMEQFPRHEQADVILAQYQDELSEEEKNTLEEKKMQENEKNPFAALAQLKRSE